MSRKIKALFVFLLAIGGIGFYHYFSPHTYHCAIPIAFNRSHQPVMEIEIEGKNLLVMFDSGSTRPLSLEKNIGDLLHKTRKGRVSWSNIKGHFYQSPCYMIPQLKLGGIPFENIIVSEINQDDMNDSCIIPGKEEITAFVGNLGNSILDKVNILCDFPDSTMFLSNDWEQLKNEGYQWERMIPLPLEKSPLLVIEAVTDLGKQKFMVDTGSSINLLKTKAMNRSSYTSSKLVMGDGDFGAITFVLLDLAPQFGDIDGILGMSFLENHVIYIDRINNVLYIEK